MSNTIVKCALWLCVGGQEQTQMHLGIGYGTQNHPLAAHPWHTQGKVHPTKLRAVLSVNAALLGINWEIGRMITLHEADAGWGAKIIDRLAEDLRLEFPDMKGFSIRNLRYMREFYQAYPFLILQPVVTKLP